MRLVRGAIALAAIGIVLLLWRSPLAPGPSVRFTLEFSHVRFALLLLPTYVALWTVHFALTRATLRVEALRFLVCTASLAALFGALEIPALFGWIDWRLALPTVAATNAPRIKPWRNPWNQLDPELLYVRKPNGRLKGSTPGDCVGWLGIAQAHDHDYDLRFDARGFRNARTLERAAVALLGDSFVEAVLVKDEELCSTRLARALDVDVANLGMSGYGPQQELATLRRFALPLQPRVIFWFFFEGNDLSDVRRYVEMRRDWDATVKRLHGFGERSFTANVLAILANACAPRLTEDAPDARRRSARLRDGSGRLGERLYFPYPSGPLSDADRASLGEVESMLGEADLRSKQQGARLVVVFVPDKWRVYHDLVETPAGSVDVLRPPNELPQLLADSCAQRKISWLDLTAPLTERARAGELLYFLDDGHWNARGHEAVAACLVEWVRRSGALADAR